MRLSIMLLAAAALMGGAGSSHAQYVPPGAVQSQISPYFDLEQAAAQQYAQQQPFYPEQQAAWDGYAPGYDEQPAAWNDIPAEDTFCEDGTCGCCTRCGSRHGFFGTTELLMWWGKGSITPPLVTTSPQGTTQSQAGVLPNAQVLFGREYLGDNLQIGCRVMAGLWLDPEQNVGVLGRFYGTGGDTSTFNRASDGNPILARPFYNVLLDQNDALLVAFDENGDITDGSISARFSNQNFLAAEACLQIMMVREQRRRVDLLAGYQFTRLDDGLTIDSSQILRTFGDIQLDLHDRFVAHNEFHGGLIGLRSQMSRNCLALECLVKVALGLNKETVQIDGTTFVDGVQQPTGGLLALPTNIGFYKRDRLVAIPEFTTNLKYYATPNLSFHLGYSLLLFSDVVVSGKQIDTGLNPTQFITGNLVGEPRPAFHFRGTSYWFQGLNFGLNWNF